MPTIPTANIYVDRLRRSLQMPLVLPRQRSLSERRKVLRIVLPSGCRHHALQASSCYILVFTPSDVRVQTYGQNGCLIASNNSFVIILKVVKHTYLLQVLKFGEICHEMEKAPPIVIT